ncbi:MAG: SLBB domain-containing protein [Candidatus Krumholzibacteriaceae bacterium]|jgi:protein involved in polysaccharide export with SLBB domain
MKSYATNLLIVALALALSSMIAPAAMGQQQDVYRQDVLKKKGLKNIEQSLAVGAGGTSEEQPGEQPTPAALLSNLPTLERAIDPDQYVLGPYDGLVVSIMGPEPRIYSLNVLPEGDVLIPGVGPVHADGLTLTEFRRALAAKVNIYFRNIDLYCYLETPAVFRVFVTGEVANPGPVAVSGVERVTDAIEGAGSVKSNGSLRLITVERGGKEIRVDLLRFVQQGDLGNNPFLRSGDRVHVPPAGWHATIQGQVKKPGNYEIIEGETVADLIDLAAGFTTEAIDDSVLVARIAAGGIATVGIPKSRFGMPLADQDEIGVFDRLKGRRYVQVEGATLRTGRFFLAQNEGVADLIVRAGGLKPTADRSAAYIQKKNGTTVKLDLKDYMSPAPAKTIELEDGDALAIPEMPKTVSVGGEVNEPGQFPYNGDMTIVQYIGLAGGPTKDGSVDRVVIYSPDGHERGVGRDAHPDRGDVVIVKKSAYKVFGDFFSGVIRIGTIVVSILILNK